MDHPVHFASGRISWPWPDKVPSLDVDHPANNVPDERSDEHVVELNIAVAENIPESI